MATVVGLYNIALAAVGERTIDSTAEQREARRELDKVYARNGGAPKYLLEQGLWNFATTRAILTASTNTPAFQYSFASSLPSDYVRLKMVSSSSDLKDSLYLYDVEGTALLSNSSVTYIQYVSNSSNYGGNLTIWPESFTTWAGHWLATQIYSVIKQPRVSYEDLADRTDKLLTSARQKAAAEGVQPFPERGIMDVRHRELDYPLEVLGRMPAPKQE